MSRLNILIGIAGSGKSSFAQRQAIFEPNDRIVSSDAIRKELYNDASCQDNPSKVFDIMYERALDLLCKDYNVWYDATNLSQKHRKALCNKMRHNVRSKTMLEIHYWFILTTPEECIARQEQRKRKVPKKVILQQMQKFRLPYPKLEEKYDELHFVNTSTYQVYGHEELKKTIGFNQNNRYHSLDLYNHLMTTGNLMSKNYTDKTQAYFAIQTGFYHDIGKLYCQTTDENGESHYYNHQNVSTYLFLCYFIDKYPDLEEEIYNAALVIQAHMEPYFYKEKEIRKRYGALTGTILQLHEADIAAH